MIKFLDIKVKNTSSKKRQAGRQGGRKEGRRDGGKEDRRKEETLTEKNRQAYEQSRS